MNIIETKALVRYFLTTPAVDGLDLEIPKGSIFGLLGENGSGKTTTIKMMMGLLVPNEGEVRVFDTNPLLMPQAMRARIGYVADEMGLPSWMKLHEAMDLHASFFEHWDREEAKRLMEVYELSPKQRFGALSKGQMRRFFLLLTVAQKPDLLILDEPAGGLDVAVRRQFLDVLLDLANRREVTILLSSHLLSDVERVVDNVAFVKKGKLIRQAALEELKVSVKRICLDSEGKLGTLRQRFEVLSTRGDSGTTLAVVSDFDESKLEGLDARVEHLNLEDIFLVYNQAGVKDVCHAQ
jgi:ABC-type multidrug transport system ATPase subunit